MSLQSGALLVGDSHLAGGLGAGLVELFDRQRPGLPVEVRAEVGWGVTDWLVAGHDWPTGLEAILVALGTNDALAVPRAWTSDAVALATRLASGSPGARLVWIAPPVLGAQATYAGRYLDTRWQAPALDEALPEGWQIIDSAKLIGDLPQAPDGVHYSGAAGREWAQRVWATLASADRDQRTPDRTGWTFSVAVVAAGFTLWALYRALRRRA